jgi:hypothetical protein
VDLALHIGKWIRAAYSEWNEELFSKAKVSRNQYEQKYKSNNKRQIKRAETSDYWGWMKQGISGIIQASSMILPMWPS